MKRRTASPTGLASMTTSFAAAMFSRYAFINVPAGQ
jgi:hypothetical protein